MPADTEGSALTPSTEVPMDEMCYIFNTKLGAWVGVNDPYTSDVTKAKQFDLPSAIKYCKSRPDFAVPVRQSDILQVRAK